MNFKKQFTDGLLDKNPVFVQLLGMSCTYISCVLIPSGSTNS